MVDQLRKNEVFLVKPERQHSTYEDHKPLLQADQNKLPINNSMNNVNSIIIIFTLTKCLRHNLN